MLRRLQDDRLAFQHGIDHIKTVEHGGREWLEEHEYESGQQMRDSMRLLHCANPAALEQAYSMPVPAQLHIVGRGYCLRMSVT